MKLLVKICGMRDAGNIRDVLTLNPDFMGFIFYSKSSRYVDTPDEINLVDFPEKLIKTGVFVNEPFETIMQIVQLYHLQAVQLHGSESPLLCKMLADKGLKVLKVFSIEKAEDFQNTSVYEGLAEYFLFDTKTPVYGGSGTKFDWQLLNNYRGKTPFFISGGISEEDASAIKSLQHPLLYGVDLNSRFEDAPAIKNITTLKKFIQNIQD
jgi:phosphoribosylanthranilate isomerase